MNSEFKNKLYELGEYLLSENMENEFLKLVKISQDVSSGKMPDFSWFEDINTFGAIAEFYEHPEEWKQRFLDLNSDKILEWDVKRELGSGAFGNAYELEDGRVLKIFHGPGALEEYRRMEEASFDPEEGTRHDLRVYDYGIFVSPEMDFYDKDGEGENLEAERRQYGYSSVDLGYAVIEKLKVPSGEFQIGKGSEQGLLKIVSDFCRRWYLNWSKNPKSPPPSEFSDHAVMAFMKENGVWPDFIADLRRPARRKQYVRIENLKRDGINMYGMQEDWIEQYMLSNFKSLLRGHTDTKPENMGYRGDTPVFFDAHRHPIDYEMPEDLQKVRNWDKDAQLALLSEYLDIKTGQLRQNLDYNEAEDMVLTEELAKQYGLEYLLPSQIEGGRYGVIFEPGSKIREYVNDVFRSQNADADHRAKQDWIDRFLDKNSDVLAKYDPVRHLGNGAYADAWETDDGRVIKIIRDDKDLSFYKEQQEELHSGKGSARNIMVYDMGVFDVPWAQEPYDIRKLKRMSWVVIEKLNPIRDLVKDYTSQLSELANFLKKKDSEIQLDEDILKRFKKAFAFMKLSVQGEVESFSNVPPPLDDSESSKMDYARAIDEWFTMSEEYREELYPTFKDIEKKVGLPSNWDTNIRYSMVFHLLQGDNDLHSGNVGFRGEQPVYYDPSNRVPDGMSPRVEYSSSPSPSKSTSDENSTIYFGDNTYIDEEDETIDEEAKAEFSNKTFDWEHS